MPPRRSSSIRLGQLLPLVGAQAGGRFVQQQHPGHPRQRAGHLEPPLLAERETLGRARGPVEEPHAFEALLGV